MRSHLALLLLAVAVTTLAGCVDDDVMPTTRALLSTGCAFTVAPTESMTILHAELRRGATTETADVSLAVAGGSAAVRADDERLAVAGLTVDFDDIPLPVDIFPAAPVLTGVHLGLAAPTTMDAWWSADDEMVLASVAGELRLDWSLPVGHDVCTRSARRS